MIEQGQIYAVEFQNFRRVHRNRANGELFAIELEITESDWHHLGSFPQDAIGDIALRWTERAAEEKPKREPKAKEPTPYGQFWRELDRAGFHNRGDVRAWLNAEGLSESETKAKLRRYFLVTSRARELSPDMLIAGLATFGELMDGAITMAETARESIGGL